MISKSFNVKKLFLWLFLVLHISSSESLLAANGGDRLSIKIIPPKNAIYAAVGDTWEIYLDGPIDNDAPARLRSELLKQGVRGGSVDINSPGGSLFAGMEIGRIIREGGFYTYVAKEGKRKYESLPGECYSACVFAYIGGNYRFWIPQSRLGVHRFSTNSPTSADLDIAQVTSAAITNYLKEMGVDIDIFNRMVTASKDEILILNQDDMKKLRVINDGRLPAKWSIGFDGDSGWMYLKGEQQTWGGSGGGMGKAIFMCGNNKVIFVPIFEEGANAETVVKSSGPHAIRFDNDFVPVVEKPVLTEYNGFVRGMVPFGDDQIDRLVNASSVGYAVILPSKDYFWGFTVDTSGSREMIRGFVKNCKTAGHADSQ